MDFLDQPFSTRCYDGNGNVTALTDAVTGTRSGIYEYGPFGQTLRLEGIAAAENGWRFSTKRVDPVTAMVLYEYRVYNPTIGRWLSKDPIEEAGGLNLLVFVDNSVADSIDIAGLFREGVRTVGSANAENVKPVMELLEQAGSMARSLPKPAPRPVPLPLPLPRAKRCKRCCTCVTGLEIGQIQRINEGVMYGHEFTVIIVPQQVPDPTELGSDATLQWKEKSNRHPKFYQSPPQSEVDLRILYPGSDVFDQWFGRIRRCPGIEKSACAMPR